jgi:hypothetical protein
MITVFFKIKSLFPFDSKKNKNNIGLSKSDRQPVTLDITRRGILFANTSM